MRQVWLDYSRAFACVLVAVGHLLMSFLSSGIMEEHWTVSFFIDFIYHFHVYIFFYCSGYLLQKSMARFENRTEFIKYKLIRCVDFAVVYFIFTAVTYCIKVFLSGDVNSEVSDSLLHALFVSPLNQMWYLYAMIAITALIPFVKTKRDYLIMLSAALIMKAVSVFADFKLPVPFNYLLSDYIWVVLGMVCAYKRIEFSGKMVIMLGVIFVGLCVVDYVYSLDSRLLDTVITFTGIVASVEGIRILTKNKTSVSSGLGYVSKYMLQIYLLHTIFAAGIRIVLIKLEIGSWVIHTVAGLVFSFVPPVICAIIAERIKIFNIVFFPSKTVLALKKNNTK